MRLANAEARLDAAKRKCNTGYGCGRTCISVQKECRSQGGAAISKERIARLEQLARGEIKPRGIGRLEPEKARAKAEQLRTARSGKAATLSAQRKATRPPMDADGLIPTDQPFNAAQKRQIKEGIKKRTTTTGQINYGAEEVADSMLKLAEGPGGRNMRKLLAFIQEAGITNNITASIDVEVRKNLGIEANQLPWTKALPLAKVVRDLGLVSDERLEWMRQDNTEAGQALLAKAMIVRNPPKPSKDEVRAKEIYEDAKTKYNAAERAYEERGGYGPLGQTTKQDALWYERQQLANARNNYRNHRDGRLNEIKWAAREFLSGGMASYTSLTESGGFFRHGQKAYVVIGGGDAQEDWNSVYRVDPAATDPKRMRDDYANHIEQFRPENRAKLEDNSRNFDVLNAPLASGSKEWAEKAIGFHIHEIGHAVDDMARVYTREVPDPSGSGGTQTVLSHPLDRNSLQSRPAEVQRLLKEKQGPSAYALTNDAELFAESFSAWAVAPEAFERTYPELYQWVEERVTAARTNAVRHSRLPYLEER